MNGITTRGWSGARIGTKIFDDITREKNSGPMAKVVFIQVKKFPDISPDKQIRYFHRKKKFSAFLLNPRCSQYRLSGVSSRLLCPLNQTKTDHLGLFLYMRDEATSGVGRDKMSEMLWLEFLVVLRSGVRCFITVHLTLSPNPPPEPTRAPLAISVCVVQRIVPGRE